MAINLKSFSFITTPIIKMFGYLHWKQTHPIHEQDKQIIHEMLAANYYVILTRRSNHISTYMTSFATRVLTGKWGFWSHALANLEDEVKDPSDFRLIEATGKGIGYSSFDQVFGDVDAVALLKPKKVTAEEWTIIMDGLKTNLGKPYDNLFDLADSTAMSCVELVRAGLKTIPNYETEFADFEKMIAQSSNLSPQTFFECPDFEVVYTVKR